MGARFDKINQDKHGYNGWKNYPTWCVNLWLSNDEGLYHQVMDHLNILPQDDHDRRENAEELKRWVTDDLAPDLGATFVADLLGYALGEVDWYEIADAWIEA